MPNLNYVGLNFELCRPRDTKGTLKTNVNPDSSNTLNLYTILETGMLNLNFVVY